LTNRNVLATCFKGQSPPAIISASFGTTLLPKQKQKYRSAKANDSKPDSSDQENGQIKTFCLPALEVKAPCNHFCFYWKRAISRTKKTKKSFCLRHHIRGLLSEDREDHIRSEC